MMIYLFILWLLQPQKVREENWKPFAVVCACYQIIAISDTFSFHPLFPKLSFMQVRLLISGSFITLQLISICFFVIVEREILKEMKQNHLGFIPDKCNSILTLAAAAFFIA